MQKRLEFPETTEPQLSDLPLISRTGLRGEEPTEVVHRVELTTNVEVTIDGELTENEKTQLTAEIIEAVEEAQEAQYKMAEMNLWIR